ncbi:MAG: hypothetical protein HWN67_04150 [Candidatus Helarchaeota archaeon]|nr:hypothetical protein [Candidatus Helarchaeota archaeon]
MKHSKRRNRKTKIEELIKKNPKLEALRRLPPEVIARAIKSKMNEEDNKK